MKLIVKQSERMQPIEITASKTLQFKLALALPIGRGQAYLGWLDDPEASPHSLTLYFDDGETSRIPLHAGDARLVRTPRPREQGAGGERQAGGFAIWIPVKELKGSQPLVTLNDQAADATKVRLLEPAKAIAHADLLEAYGTTLAALARSQRDPGLLKLLAKPLADLATRRGNAFGNIEQAWRVAGHLLVIARVACEPGRVETIHYESEQGKAADISKQMHRFPLPTEKDAHGRPIPGHVCGLCFVMPLSALPRADKCSLKLSIAQLGELDLPLRPLETQLEALPDILIARPQVVPVVLEALQKQARGAALRRQLAVLARQCFERLWARSRNFDAYGDVCAAGIPGAFAFGEEGIAIFGLLARPEGAPFRIYLHAEERLPSDVTRHMIFLPIDGDLTSVREKLPAAGRNLSFFGRLPIATAGGERRMLRVVMPGVPDIWVRVETRALQEQGKALVRAILNNLPRSAWLWRNFDKVCDRGLGRILELAASTRAAQRSQPHIHEYGTRPLKPWLSIVIPLTQRGDHLRQQLAQFCDDPDFKSGIDLIYVVDNPELETETLDLAERYQPLFELPLRVLSYDESRGASGAINAAAAVARAPLLLLMDSSVLPQQAGWLTLLRRAFDTLPRCGMFAPLLEIPDGLASPLAQKPVEKAALDAGCLLLRKQDFDAAGGLDEAYDSSRCAGRDLSLRMASTRKRQYLVPAARLWQLEDEASLASQHSERRLLGLFDAWRLKNKIAAGLLPKPGLLKAG